MSENEDIYSKKRVVGHSDEKKRIREKDGWIFKGEELGYVDKDGRVREKDGWIFKGNTIGEIKDNKAKAEDGFIFKGEKYGYVDKDGNIRLKDGMLFRGRIIGQVRGKNVESALAFFMLKFKKLEDKYEALKSDVDCDAEKGKYLGRIRKMLDYVPEANALGDFDSLLGKLKVLERQALEHLDKNLKMKEALCDEAERLSDSTAWRETHERLKQMRQEWKEIGFVPKEKVDDLWSRFNRAIDLFYQRRKEYFEEREQRKEQWLERMAERISRKEAKVESLEESIEYDEGKIDEWQNKIWNLRPGGRAEEIKDHLEDKIDSVQGKIESKRYKIKEIRQQIYELEQKRRNA